MKYTYFIVYKKNGNTDTKESVQFDSESEAESELSTYESHLTSCGYEIISSDIREVSSE